MAARFASRFAGQAKAKARRALRLAPVAFSASSWHLKSGVGGQGPHMKTGPCGQGPHMKTGPCGQGPHMKTGALRPGSAYENGALRPGSAYENGALRPGSAYENGPCGQGPHMKTGPCGQGPHMKTGPCGPVQNFPPGSAPLRRLRPAGGVAIRHEAVELLLVAGPPQIRMNSPRLAPSSSSRRRSSSRRLSVSSRYSSKAACRSPTSCAPRAPIRRTRPWHSQSLREPDPGKRSPHRKKARAANPRATRQ